MKEEKSNISIVNFASSSALQAINGTPIFTSNRAESILLDLGYTYLKDVDIADIRMQKQANDNL